MARAAALKEKEGKSSSYKRIVKGSKGDKSDKATAGLIMCLSAD